MDKKIDTPCLVIDKAVMLNNIQRAQEYANQHGIQLRPHIKTHKSVYCAQQQLAAGAVGITCQKIGEAEVMAEHGCEDLFISFNIIGEPKYSRLNQLRRKAQVRVSVDNAVIAAGLNESTKQGKLPVLIECDTGMHRCGVTSPAQALVLAQQIDSMPHLQLQGLMTYPAKGMVTQVAAWLAEAKELFNRHGLCCDIISGGNTPDMFDQHQIKAQTEMRSGTYIFNDRMMQATGVCDWQDCAVSIYVTVVSTPQKGRAIIDAGVKTLSAETGWVQGYGRIVEYPDAEIYALNEEHGYVRCEQPLTIGEQLRIIPNHICVTMNLQNQAYLDTDGELEVINIEARGKGR